LAALDVTQNYTKPSGGRQGGGQPPSRSDARAQILPAIALVALAATIAISRSIDTSPGGACQPFVWRTFVWTMHFVEAPMKSFFETIWYDSADLPGMTWAWFNNLNREEWLVVLAVVCASGFVCMLGFRGSRV
jgi:hypothetical protein